MNNNTIREREKSQTFVKNSKFIFKQSELVFMMFVAKTRSMNKRVRVFQTRKTRFYQNLVFRCSEIGYQTGTV